jgi:hypothetical protein
VDRPHGIASSVLELFRCWNVERAEVLLTWGRGWNSPVI